MPNFSYKARDNIGKAVSGKMEAGTRELLIDKLRKMGYMVTDVSEIRSGLSVESLFEKLKPIGSDEMILFYVQFSNMLTAGIPMLGALDTLERQIKNKKLSEAVGSVGRSIEGGESLSKALAKHPAIFPRLFVNMVKAGEVSGKLDTVASRYASYFEHQEDLKQKVRGALFYPMILTFAGVAVTIFIVTFVIPQFAAIFSKSGIALPAPTRILFASGTAIKKFWYVGILALGAIFAGFKYYARTEGGRLVTDRMKLKIPVMGELYRKAAVSGFSRTLGTLSGSGVPILEALDITKDVVENEVLARVITNARKGVEKGEKLADALRLSAEFPLDAVQMISVGEETGDLDGMLTKIADFYDLALGYTIKKLTTVLEPLFISIMGALVGFIMASMLMPMFDMVQIIKR